LAVHRRSSHTVTQAEATEVRGKIYQRRMTYRGDRRAEVVEPFAAIAIV